jgi:hypothetical protein
MQSIEGPSFKKIIPLCKNCLYFKEKIGEISARCSLLDDRKVKYQLNVIGGYDSSPDSNCPFLTDNTITFLYSEIKKLEDLKISNP